MSEGSFYGSNLSRTRARHDIFGFLCDLELSSSFFTVSPNSAGTFIIAEKSGKLSRDAVIEANWMLLPNRGERKAIAASHPMECARYFERIVNVVIRDILGWNQKMHRPKRGGGIFGVVRAFGAAAETQQAGALHVHFVVWPHGIHTTSTAAQNAMETNPSFRSRIVDFANTIATTLVPCVQKENICYHHESGSLQLLHLESKHIADLLTI